MRKLIMVDNLCVSGQHLHLLPSQNRLFVLQTELPIQSGSILYQRRCTLLQNSLLADKVLKDWLQLRVALPT